MSCFCRRRSMCRNHLHLLLRLHQQRLHQQRLHQLQKRHLQVHHCSTNKNHSCPVTDIVPWISHDITASRCHWKIEGSQAHGGPLILFRLCAQNRHSGEMDSTRSGVCFERCKTCGFGLWATLGAKVAKDQTHCAAITFWLPG